MYYHKTKKNIQDIKKYISKEYYNQLKIPVLEKYIDKLFKENPLICEYKIAKWALLRKYFFDVEKEEIKGLKLLKGGEKVGIEIITFDKNYQFIFKNEKYFFEYCIVAIFLYSFDSSKTMKQIFKEFHK